MPGNTKNKPLRDGLQMKSEGLLVRLMLLLVLFAAQVNFQIIRRNIMKFSEKYYISTDVLEIADIDLEKDTALFLSAKAIRKARSMGTPEALRANQILDEASEFLIRAIESDDDAAIKALGKGGGEINSFHLGYSRGRPRGKGSSLTMALYEMKKLNIPWGAHVDKMLDAIPYVAKGISLDRSSDLLTRLLIYDFADYTKRVLDKYHIPYTTRMIKTYCWERFLKKMTNVFVDYVILDGMPITFVPKEFVVEKAQALASAFYSQVILEKKKLEPDWPEIKPTAENKLPAPKKMSKREYLQENVPCVKDAIQEEINAKPDETMGDLADFIEKQSE